MCLAVPAKIIRLLENQEAVVDMGGVFQTISTAFVPEARVGQHVVVHVGFALSILDEEEARKSLALFESLPEAEGGL
ncbi:MAG: HypC/HybG/HupF family hydrogenase formation chaperone [Cystobacterineae bacterium]|nr:HypC/HybG/HupF family hydrogenase formation chaperone [Cystobacterineae bacterium]